MSCRRQADGRVTAPASDAPASRSAGSGPGVGDRCGQRVLPEVVACYKDHPSSRLGSALRVVDRRQTASRRRSKYRGARILEVDELGGGQIGSLSVASLTVCDSEEVGEELLTVFRYEMARVERVPAQTYEEFTAEEETFTDAYLFRAPGRLIADRLDLMGIDAAHVLSDLERELRYQAGPIDDDLLGGCDDQTRAFIRAEQEMLAEMSAQDWIGRLAATPPEALRDTSPGAGGWLLNYLDRDDGWDARRRLRVMLLAFPDAEVTLDATWISGWHASDPGAALSAAQTTVRDYLSAHSPLIVLTEGKTDAEFLGTALAVLYPHLTDLVRFLDYERKPEGGAGAVLRAVRAFDAAGIANRLVAVLDNDTAAAEALRGFGSARVSDRIRVIQYPPLGLARHYPTVRPLAARSPAAAIERSDVNGRAASIELYLGRDVLTRTDGRLYPVQWKSISAGVGQHHGEVTGKHEIHQAFRAKAAAASRDPAIVSQQDWDGLRLILDSIRSAFHQQSPTASSGALAGRSKPRRWMPCLALLALASQHESRT
jgi:hypothetical protein